MSFSYPFLFRMSCMFSLIDGSNSVEMIVALNSIDALEPLKAGVWAVNI